MNPALFVTCPCNWLDGGAGWFVKGVRIMAIRHFNDALLMAPIEVKAGDGFAAKIVAVAGGAGDWALYIGPSDWPDQKVKDHGNRLGRGEVPFAHVMQLREYRD